MDQAVPFPATTIKLENGIKLVKGENGDQSPAWIIWGGTNDPLAPSQFKWESGKPGYNTIADLVQVTEVLRLMVESFRRSWHRVEPYAVVAGKHGNPCGAAISFTDPLEAIHKALIGDPVAVMGGEVETNFPIGDDEAEALLLTKGVISRPNWGLDFIAAPSFSPNAIERLRKKGDGERMLFSNPALTESPFPENEWIVKPAGADWLCQKAPRFVLTPEEILHWSGKEMTVEQFENAIIVFSCVWRATSNTVGLANNRMLIGLGCGQQDRIACTHLCIDKANRSGHDMRGSMFGSDGFIPYATSTAAWSESDRFTFKGALQAAGMALDQLSSQRDMIKVMANLAAMISRMDKREPGELLIDAGCAGGIVPYDGKRREEVRGLFEYSGSAVGFVDPSHRGFSRHAG